MQIIKNISLFILLISSLNIFGQAVTFQSYMTTTPWAEQVLLNGNPLLEISSGEFEIPPSDVLPGKNIIEFVSLPSTLNGVSTLDLVLIKRAIFGIDPLDPTGIIPADLNQSAFVGIEDVAIIRNRILGWDTEHKFSFAHPSVDLNTLDMFDFGPDFYKFCFNGSDFDNIDFTFDVYLIGDVNQTAMLKPSHELGSEVRSNNMILSIVDTDLVEGKNFEIPFSFYADDKIEGLQMEFENEDIIIKSIELETYNYEVYINNSIESKTRLVLISDNPSKEINGTIIGASYKNAKISSIISISSDFHDEVVYDDLGLSGVSLEFGTTSLDDDVVNLDNLVISPNPVQDYFSIQIPTNLSEISTFTITNSHGQVVMKEAMLNNNLLVERNELGASGLYILTWQIGNKTVHKKMIVL